MSQKSRILLIGCGGIGSIAALNLETGGKAEVTAILRSNYAAIKENGINFKSIDHGVVNGFRPTYVRNNIPYVIKEKLEPFKYIVCTTKNIPDIPPTLDENIRPAVTPDYTVIVLIQNGLNIEKPIISAFPTNVILSGVSFCGSHEVGYGNIVHEDNDELTVGAFHNSKLNSKLEEEEARKFCEIYGSGGKCIVEYNFDVAWTRWRKLLYNACLNSICAMTDLDTGRIQLADGAVDNLVRPAMEEIRAAAKASGYDIPPELVDFIIKIDLITMYDPPSMQVDIRKGRYCEFENIVGEPLREGLAKGIPMPTLTVFYNILMAIQWRLKEKNGLIEIPEPEDHTVPNQPLGVKFNSR